MDAARESARAAGDGTGPARPVIEPESLATLAEPGREWLLSLDGGEDSSLTRFRWYDEGARELEILGRGGSEE